MTNAAENARTVEQQTASGEPVPAAPDDPLAAARALGPRITELAAAIEEARQLPVELVEELRAAGLFRMMLPPDLGGLGTDPVAANRAVEEVSMADGSTGWCVMLAQQSALFAGYMAPAHALEIWGAGAVVAGTARPIGRAEATSSPAEGYVVSGRWPFASGSSHAGWFAAECLVYEGDTPRLDAKGEQVTRMTFVPREAVTIHDVWDTLGLRGTASNDFSIEGAFVPAGRGFQVLVDPPLHHSPLYHDGVPLVFATHGAQALGVARGAIEAARTIAASKRGWGGVLLADVPRVQATIAEATALVESAREWLYATAEALWHASLEGSGDSSLLRARVHLATTHAAASSVRAVDLLHGLLATSAIFRSSPLERRFRDIHTAAAHVMIGPLTLEAAGRVELGADAAFPFF